MASLLKNGIWKRFFFSGTAPGTGGGGEGGDWKSL
jgi:hypothetical protein